MKTYTIRVTALINGVEAESSSAAIGKLIEEGWDSEQEEILNIRTVRVTESETKVEPFDDAPHPVDLMAGLGEE